MADSENIDPEIVELINFINHMTSDVKIQSFYNMNQSKSVSIDLAVLEDLDFHVMRATYSALSTNLISKEVFNDMMFKYFTGDIDIEILVKIIGEMSVDEEIIEDIWEDKSDLFSNFIGYCLSQIIDCVNEGGKDKSVFPSDDINDFWSDEFSTLKIDFEPEKIFQRNHEKMIANNPMLSNIPRPYVDSSGTSYFEGLVVTYSRPIQDVKPKNRTIARALKFFGIYDSRVKDLYNALYQTLIISDGKIKPTVTESNGFVAPYMIDDADELIKQNSYQLSELLSDANNIIKLALDGKFGEPSQDFARELFENDNQINNTPSTFGNKKTNSNGSSTSVLIGKEIDTGKPVFWDDERSLITIAPPGSGKTQCHVLPNLMRFEGGAIVLDIKGECFSQSAQWRSKNVGPVLSFSPENPHESKRYNPLSFVSQNPDEVWDDARLLAEMLIVPKSKSDPTWETQGQQFLALLIAYVTFLPEINRNMTTILDLASEIGLSDAFDDVLAEDAPFPSSMRRAANKFKQMKETSEKQFTGVLSGANQHLSVWEGSSLENITSTSDWSPEDFRVSAPSTLYLCVPPHKIETYAPVLRVIIAQHVRYLMREEPNKDTTPILFMLDEMPRLGNMAPIREALEAGRSYGIRLWMFAQYAGQIQDAYGKEIANGMIESCGARIYMNPSLETAEHLSKILGTKENAMTGKTKPVVKPQKLAGPKWRDDMLVLATGENPLRLRKSFFHQQVPEGEPSVDTSSKEYTDKEIAEMELENRSRL